MQQPNDALVDALARHGWVVSDELVSTGLRRGLLGQCQNGWEAGCFRQAAVGHGKGRSLRPNIRGDSICWIEPNQAQGATATFLDWTEQLRTQLNRELFAGLRSSEFHFARYPKGHGYAKHMDQHKGQAHRSISLVLYLNEDWSAEDGGELCLYERQDDTREMARILPRGGRIVLFRSDLVPHEVLPCGQARWSLTGWFRTDDVAAACAAYTEPPRDCSSS